MAIEITTWHWRDTMRPARFFMFDGRVALFIVMILAHPRMYTLVIFVAFLFFFYMLERFGISFEAAMRRFRSFLCGNVRPAHIWTARRRMVDLGVVPTE